MCYVAAAPTKFRMDGLNFACENIRLYKKQLRHETNTVFDPVQHFYPDVNVKAHLG